MKYQIHPPFSYCIIKSQGLTLPDKFHSRQWQTHGTLTKISVTGRVGKACHRIPKSEEINSFYYWVDIRETSFGIRARVIYGTNNKAHAGPAPSVEKGYQFQEAATVHSYSRGSPVST